jgi:2-oxoglutarate dehydrogenase E2 component (dihydrolipoamide succinyltransferase)
MAKVDIEVPAMGESVAEATLLSWHKAEGDYVDLDEPICEMETDKANVDVPAPAAGVIALSGKPDETYAVGDVIGTIDPDGKPGEESAEPSTPATADKQVAEGDGQAVKSDETRSAAAVSADKLEDLAPAVRRMVAEHGLDPDQINGTGRGGRLTKEDVLRHVDAKAGSPTPATPPTEPKKQAAPPPTTTSPKPAAAGTRRVAMSKIRKRIAQNLLNAQQNAAILTTFNEVDLHAVMAMRSSYKEPFKEKHGIGLGFMSFFAKATCVALREFERVNAKIDGDEMVFHDHVNLGIAVSTERGLMVPVIKSVEEMSFATIESEIKRVALAARDGKLGLDEMSGGTFTITNGGVFGSLLSTPILNPPQSGILGMHTIQQRPVAVDGQVVIRPMMYIALSYDHRMVDGKESVSFLVRIKQLLEDPARLLLDV